MTLHIPLGGKDLHLELQENEIEYQVTTSSGQKNQQNKNVGNVQTYVTALYNNVVLVFRNEQITTALSEIFIWNTLDPYAAFPSGQLQTGINYMDKFTELRTSLNGDLGQLLTFRSLGSSNIGGNIKETAYFESLRSNHPLSLVSIGNSPNYDEYIGTVCHEIGHILGSHHTHDCLWNGNNTAIDGCSGIWVEGVGCPWPGFPPDGGTIMSYCDRNLNLGFGPQPGNVIRNTVINADCLAYITGSELILYGYGGNTYMLGNHPAGTLQWSVTGPFTLNSTTANPVTVTCTSSTGNGTLTAKIAG